MRCAAKRDGSEAAVVAVLEKFGCTVIRLSQRGIPDLLVKTPDGRVHIIECKDRGGTFTADQLKFIRKWGPVAVVRTPEGAVRWLIDCCQGTVSLPC